MRSSLALLSTVLILAASTPSEAGGLFRRNRVVYAAPVAGPTYAYPSTVTAPNYVYPTTIYQPVSAYPAIATRPTYPYTQPSIPSQIYTYPYPNSVPAFIQSSRFDRGFGFGNGPLPGNFGNYNPSFGIGPGTYSGLGGFSSPF